METSTANSFDFSAEVIVGKHDRYVVEAIRYHLERSKGSSDAPTEIRVVDAKNPGYRRVVPLVMGDGVVELCVPCVHAIKYDVRKHEISLRSENKGLLYDFVYGALNAYDEINSN